MPGAADRVNLLDRVAAILDEAGARYAVIGAAALAARGVARSTRDVDLLALADTCLDAARWAPLAEAGIEVTISRGDAEDPLSGVVRFTAPDERPVDLVVGRHRWQARVLDRATPVAMPGAPLPTAQARDLVLLKLFAGGAQDAWDVLQLLAGPDRETLVSQVSADVDVLPARCRRLWEQVLEDCRGPSP